MNRELVDQRMRNLQQSIILQLEEADGIGKFGTDVWNHHEKGGGITRVIRSGRVIEKGGVNFSAVGGMLTEKAAKALEMETRSFFATGVSIVLHPSNPHVPIIHMNVRYFEGDEGKYWFGGGIDLTPHYIVENDASWFHSTLKTVCDKWNPEFYTRFKDWADEYFYLPHRQETRGIGGIFFDRLSENSVDLSKDEIAGFVFDVGNSFAPIYTTLMAKYGNMEFDADEKKWQLLRRGRYAEFNLAIDRGTKFGLETGGRTESILMSLPADASWEYNF
ncbi:MAG: oxygen-dependent coproporphyrinogen oxidase, partial [Bacteroidetes bacterium]|nr:oxygen-dependent coproporphyrinogen oxidase [Bacteroidota bacterium]